MTGRAGPGRPRATPTAADVPAREQVLEAAAHLFVEQGVAATSTRQIAERVGIRQASLYYHFSGKNEILAELLATSVRPTLEVVRTVEARVPAEISAAGALYALARADVATLVATPHNIGSLYLLPEVATGPFDEFRASRQHLQDAYGRLGVSAATQGESDVGASEVPHADVLGALLIQMVEVVIPLRRAGAAVPDGELVATACVRACGLGAAGVAAARAASQSLVLPVPVPSIA